MQLSHLLLAPHLSRLLLAPHLLLGSALLNGGFKDDFSSLRIIYEFMTTQVSLSPHLNFPSATSKFPSATHIGVQSGGATVLRPPPLDILLRIWLKQLIFSIFAPPFEFLCTPLATHNPLRQTLSQFRLCCHAFSKIYTTVNQHWTINTTLCNSVYYFYLLCWENNFTRSFINSINPWLTGLTIIHKLALLQ